jgi:excisionase family DNA binding protein
LRDLLFPDRVVLRVAECAAMLAVTEQHIIDLIEEGALVAVKVSGACDTVRIPRHFIDRLPARTGCSPEDLARWLDESRRSMPPRRTLWRIPARAWSEFLFARHSLLPVIRFE